MGRPPNGLIWEATPPTCGHCLSMAEAHETGALSGDMADGGLTSIHLGTRQGADTHVGGNGNSPPTRTLGRTTDASTDGVAADVRMEWHAGEA